MYTRLAGIALSTIVAVAAAASLFAYLNPGSERSVTIRSAPVVPQRKSAIEARSDWPSKSELSEAPTRGWPHPIRDKAVSPTQAGASPNTSSNTAELACREKLASRGIYPPANEACVDIDTVITKLADGTYKFNKPTDAYVDEPFHIVLALATADGQDLSAAFIGTQGPTVERSGHFAQHLEATLRGGDDFKVDPTGAQQRTATSLAPVSWEWTITPLKSGTRTIVIDVVATLIMGTQKESVQIKTLHEPIQIKVGILHWFVATFSGIWSLALGAATMVIAILGVVHYLPWGQHKGKQVTSDEPPPVELITHRHSDSSSHIS